MRRYVPVHLERFIVMSGMQIKRLEENMTRIGSKLLTGVLALAGALVTLPAAGMAQGVEFYFGDGPRYREAPPRYYRDGPPPRYREEPRYESRGGCSSRQAIRAAIRYNVSRPQVTSVTGRAIVVEGIGYHNRYVRVVFANSPGCPRIDRD